MQIKHRLAFRAEKHVDLISYLSGHNIAWKKGEIISTVEIFEDSPHWQFVHDYADENRILTIPATVFSTAELENAQWLGMRSQWRYGYPQPEAAFGYQSITYRADCHCGVCGAGLEQIAPFRMKKSPNWGKRHFMMLNWVEDELFVSDICRSVLEKEKLTGISFGPVNDKKGAAVLSNVNQMIIPAKLSPGIIPDRRSIDQVFICTSCGAVKYHPTSIGSIAYDKQSFQNAPDFVKTDEIFGWGKGAAHQIIISRKAYHILTGNKLCQGLVFEPIELV